MTGRSRWLRVVGDDRGAMTVMTAFAVAAVLALTVAVLMVGRASAAAHTARAAADLAALAGAHALRAGEPACTVADRVAGENRARLGACVIDGVDVVVRAEVQVDLGVVRSRSAVAVARAGPA
ncbi:Rv3654c family TadE-like protein [Dietzia sp. ANT_WB102]|uniref:Rv3654c family TadE-like protein n=1 Tax=Dietzia sp. ANT_WB102 TaxID=2597345 RepID=UPI0021036C29|nr:Rv3654c family TadE-like protein [Dietzia sp. ANT_WB102]